MGGMGSLGDLIGDVVSGRGISGRGFRFIAVGWAVVAAAELC